MTTTKKTSVLNIFVSFKDDGRDKLVRVGTLFHTEKNRSMINIESVLTRRGDWDGKTYFVMKQDNSDVSDIFPAMASKSGSALPVFEAKAVFQTVEGRGTKTHFINCGAAFRGRIRDDGTCKSVILTLSSKPTGDVGDWDECSYIGFPLEDRSDESPEAESGSEGGKSTGKSSGKKLETSQQSKANPPDICREVCPGFFSDDVWGTCHITQM